MSVSHLWLGLLSSVVIFLACLSGSLYAFRQQIEDLVNYKGVYVRESKNATVAPDSLLADFEGRFGTATSIRIFPEKDRSMVISSFSRNNPGITAYYDPYTGNLLSTQSKASTAFFDFILDLHRFLLAGEPGKLINGIAILIFVFMLFSGFVLWIPRKLKHLKESLRVRWKARFYRLNYDLHKVLGFYAFLLLFFIAITGLFVSFHWMKNLMIVGLGGDSIVISENNLALKKDLSDSYNALLHKLGEEGKSTSTSTWTVHAVLEKANQAFPYPGPITLLLPNDQIKNVRLSKMNQENALHFQVPDVMEFSARGELRSTMPFSSLALHEQFKSIAKPLHTGEIMGLPGIILYFLASLIGCSLPVTGFIIWWKKAS